MLFFFHVCICWCIVQKKLHRKAFEDLPGNLNLLSNCYQHCLTQNLFLLCLIPSQQFSDSAVWAFGLTKSCKMDQGCLRVIALPMIVVTLKARMKSTTFCRQHFKHILLEENLVILIEISLVCSWGSEWQKVSIGSYNGLAWKRWQAIIWTVAD